MGLGLQSLGQLANGGPVAARIATDLEQQQVLQRRNASLTSQILVQPQKAAKLVAEMSLTSRRPKRT